MLTLVKLSSFVAAAVCLARLASATQAPMRGNAADMTPQALDAALSQLTPGVQAHLRSLDPAEYSIFPDAERAAEGGLSKRSYSDDIVQTCSGTSTAVTYDDGPYKYHETISDDWNDAGQKITFFVNGYNFDCAYNAPYPKLLRKSLAQGHQIASHTWSHPHLTNLTNAQIDTQIDLVETMLLRTIGVVPRYMRAPYGETNERVAQRLMQKHGLKVIDWSDDTRDADGAALSESEQVYNNLDAKKPHIILSHETVETTAKQLTPYAIDKLKSKGLKSKTVAECLSGAPSAYKVVQHAGKRNDSWTCEGTPVPGAQ